jgi:hypothetical protein
MTEKNHVDQTWNRQAVTFRLSSRRKRDLESIAIGSPIPLSPTSAMDLAISVALAAQSASPAEDLSSDSAMLEEQLSQISSSIEAHAREQRTAISEIARQVKDLRDVMMAAAAIQSHAPDDGADVISMREWLRAETQPLPERSLLAVAKWQAKSRVDDDSFAIDILAERIATPGLGGSSARGLPAVVRLSPVESGSPASKLDSMRSAYLMCQPNAAGWTISIHPMNADDAPGDSIGMLSV